MYFARQFWHLVYKNEVNQSINTFYWKITATVADFKKTNTRKFDIKLIKNNQIVANAKVKSM